MKKVQVLLSAYNGEHYIAEQINSIIHQSYPHISILIRDDGSSDRTMEVIQALVKTYPERIKVIQGRNVGVVASFLELMRDSDPHADYYCFCDQDDVWLEHKVQSALDRMEASIHNGSPAMVFTSVYLTDSELNRKSKWPKPPERGPSYFNALYENIAIGATITLNKSARDLFIHSKNPDSSCVLMHDWWFYLLVSAFGTVIYDHHPSMLYRQHDHNVVGGSDTLLGKLKGKWGSFRRHFGKALLQRQAQEFYRIYGSRLSDDQREQLELFIAPRRRMRDRINYIRHSKLHRQSSLENLLFKLFILIGFV